MRTSLHLEQAILGPDVKSWQQIVLSIGITKIRGRMPVSARWNRYLTRGHWKISTFLSFSNSPAPFASAGNNDGFGYVFATEHPSSRRRLALHGVTGCSRKTSVRDSESVSNCPDRLRIVGLLASTSGLKSAGTLDRLWSGSHHHPVDHALCTSSR